VVLGVSPYLHGVKDQYGNPLFFNVNAFAIPGGGPNNPIGRFGNASVGSIVGPGTSIVSMSLIKSVAIYEKLRMQVGLEASNLFNHKNYLPPNTQIDSGAFGTISGLQTAEGAGPRLLKLTARINF
jgi:hypothetical protein